MAEPADLLRAWQDAIRQIGGLAAGPLKDQSEVARDLLAPFKRQTELLEEMLRRQVQFEKEVAGRVLAPLNVVNELLEQTSSAMRAQSRAFDAAATSFKQASDLLEQQAALIEGMRKSMRDPVGALKQTAAVVTRPRD